jgi:FkbM family methyltransferase
MQTLSRMLHHEDPGQLLFQISEIAGDEAYLRHGVTVTEGDVVLDVGANVGVAAAFFAVICAAGSVHCFEPVEPVFRMLRDNVGQLPACVLHPQGLSSRDGHAAITYYPGADAMSGLYADPLRDRDFVRTVLLNLGRSPQQADQELEGRYEPQTLSCVLVRLSSFLRSYGIDQVDLLKIDVERAEVDVVDGIDESDWPKIRQVVIEVHDERGRAGLLQRMLTSKGFRVTLDQEEALRGTSIWMLYAVR